MEGESTESGSESESSRNCSIGGTEESKDLTIRTNDNRIVVIKAVKVATSARIKAPHCQKLYNLRNSPMPEREKTPERGKTRENRDGFCSTSKSVIIMFSSGISIIGVQ